MIQPQRRAHWLGWAVFLGMSWTWVIGMYLPVLLVRDYGLWGWIVFAVPNVIGAAAMGWVLHRPGQSERIVAEHQVACLAFSAVTIAFHIFFTLWFLRRLPLSPSGVGVLVTVVALVGLALILGSAKGDLLAAAVTFAVSGVVIVVALVNDVVPHLGNTNLTAPLDLLWLTPVVVFGFALCPYLDLTFHRARQALSLADARAAFSAGFGGFFLLMILFSLGYSWIAHRPLHYLAAVLLLVHMSVQIAFTVAVHARELPKRDWIWLPLPAGVLAAVVPLYVASWRGLESGELVYRLFMGFYGLVFPAYVLLCMIPAKRRSLRLFWLAIALAGPFYWMGFIEQQTLWLIPGTVILLACRLVLHLGRGKSGPAASSAG